ncbi:MAG TPA: lysylphosphatidylglycerol synthase transmembrane domain-containing protein [Bacteroidia bacterium]|nr:lysylphosphatidylglycerol synthase transmembrane domain-containing protein [Bacteroidia bacterium]HRH09399.1 lysylphosphatidylglycerol synthase transmembrane domain-containing protein [Bacteroidia bacterium]
MNKSLANVLKALFFLGIGILLIWLVTRNLSDSDKKNILLAFKEAKYIWIAVAMIISGLSHWFRAVRWKMLLTALGHQPKVSTTFFAVMIGYLANFALPRLGEVSRCGVLTKYEKIPFSESFGTVITERAVDVICLLIIFGLTLLLEFHRIFQLVNDSILSPFQNKLMHLKENLLFVFLFVLFCLTCIVVFFKYKHKFQQLFSGKFLATIKGFWEGMKSVKNVKNPFGFVAYTVAIWGCYALILYCSFLCFDETTTLGWGAALAILTFGSVAIIFVPGGTGAYQALVTQLLTASYFISFVIAFAFSWIVWTSSLLVILILGIISLVLLPLLNKQTNASASDF